MRAEQRTFWTSAVMIGGGVILVLSALSCSMAPAPASDPGGADAGAAGPADGGGGGAPVADAAVPEPDADTGCAGLTGAVGDFTLSLDSGGRERNYRLHVPPGYDPTAATPLVLNFHGYTSNARQQELYTGMAGKADEAGFIAVHPDGIQNSWNAGNCCGAAARDEVDDVGFVDAVIDAVAADYCIDRRRIYATGMSNGGFMSQRLACDLSDRIAAIASVAGYNVTQSCEPTRPVPVMHFHGTADGTVDYAGVDATIRGWVDRNDCAGGPVTTYTNGNTTCETYGDCAGGSSVVLCTVSGGGHSWPGAFGSSAGIDATDAGWEFLSVQRLP